MKILPLGTSAGLPTPTRHLSGLGVFFEGEWILFDCGEGTQYQILRHQLEPSKLKAIFITHLHGDHVFGLPGLLSTLDILTRPHPLYVFGPPGLKALLKATLGKGLPYFNYPLYIQEVDPNWHWETPRYQVTTQQLEHTVESFGYRLDLKDKPGPLNIEKAKRLGVPEGPLLGQLKKGEDIQLNNGNWVKSEDVVGPPWAGSSLAYCTDTRPCRSTLELGQNANLLIHEATFTQDMTEQAHDRGHSTAYDAALTAQKAKAEKLLITHFSSRYPNPQPLLEEAKSIFPNTEAAEELKPIIIEDYQAN